MILYEVVLGRQQYKKVYLMFLLLWIVDMFLVRFFLEKYCFVFEKSVANIFVLSGADFTAAKGIAALIDDFNKRKQPLFFYNPRADVVAVFKGAALDDFQHITSEEELNLILQGMLQFFC